MTSWRVMEGDALTTLHTLDAGSAQTCVTSPPYFGLRDYGHEGQIGLEPTPDEYVAALVEVFREVRRVLRDDGTLWLNLGDSYAAAGGHTGQGVTSQRQGRANVDEQNRGSTRVPDGFKQKDLLGIPWMVAFALRADGWYLRSDIIWSKPNPMPESVTDRPTKAHEYLFLLSKSPRYYWDAEAVREPHAEMDRPQSEKRREQRMGRSVASVDGLGQSSKGIDGGDVEAGHTMQTNPGGRNKRSVWTVATQPYPGAHFAVFPPKLIEPCVLAGSSEQACGVCGAPWRRVVEYNNPRHSEEYRTQAATPKDEASRDHVGNIETTGNAGFGGRGGATSGLAKAGWRNLPAAKSRTLGFEPSCDHQDGTCSSAVLDPFAGAGTTGLVATRHGRGFVGIELNPEYAEMARERIRDDAPLMNYLNEAA